MTFDEDTKFFEEKQRLIQQIEELEDQRDMAVLQLDELVERTHFFLKDDIASGLNFPPFHHLIEENRADIEDLFHRKERQLEDSIQGLQHQYNNQQFTEKEAPLC